MTELCITFDENKIGVFGVFTEWLVKWLEDDWTLDEFLDEYTTDESMEVYLSAILDSESGLYVTEGADLFDKYGEE